MIRVAVALALVSTACALDFTRYRPDATSDRTTIDAAPGPDVVDTVVDRGFRDAPEASIDVPAVVDVIDVPPPIDMPPPPCGHASEACCASGTACDAGLTCSAGVCVACGGDTQPCCDGVCASGSVCVGATCESACGAVGQPCCAGACANTGVACSSGTCVACGAAFAMCCPTGCDTGLACSTPLSMYQSGTCSECGFFGDRCCDGATPCGEGTCTATTSGAMVCLGNAPDMRGGVCTTAGSRCSDNSRCDTDLYCGPCGGARQFCCSGVCRDGLTCGTIPRVCHEP